MALFWNTDKKDSAVGASLGNARVPRVEGEKIGLMTSQMTLGKSYHLPVPLELWLEKALHSISHRLLQKSSENMNREAFHTCKVVLFFLNREFPLQHFCSHIITAHVMQIMMLFHLHSPFA